jgi:hypothetical protein
VWACYQLPLSPPAIKPQWPKLLPPFLSLFPLRGEPPDHSPPTSHRIEPPFIDSSRIAHLHDRALPLPQVSSPESPSITLPSASRAYRPPVASESCFLLPLVTGALLVRVPHARVVLVQLENQARETSSSSSRLSASTRSDATEPSSALVRTPFPASPSRFSCSSR